MSASESSPKPVVEQEIPHVRNKDCRINTEYVSQRQGMPKTRITGPENSGNLRSLQVLQHVNFYIHVFQRLGIRNQFHYSRKIYNPQIKKAY